MALRCAAALFAVVAAQASAEDFSMGRSKLEEMRVGRP